MRTLRVSQPTAGDVSSRTVALALLLASVGCSTTESDPYPNPPYPGSGYPGDGGTGSGGGGGVYGCQADTDCAAGEVCARTYECLPPTEVRTVHISWTLEGQPASQSTCSTSPDLEIDFEYDGGGWWGWAPVPCVEGVFTIDKMPTYDNDVAISIDGDPSTQQYGMLDATTGQVAIDLPF
ncbi:MAG TPA: hypothetical protein VMJ10_15695 [Kofleriaceae bacterium]|nr:hypothetical protein [Kofleriaceae bacterium]